jgi:antibiotic biosynthesis monooxygenase (ABM) superfamily enzyme
MTEPATSTTAEPVSVAVHRQVLPGRETEAVQLFHEAIELASRFPGHLGAFVLRQAASVFTIVFRFDSAAHLDAWESSPERASIRERFEHLTLHAEIQHQSGLEPFFTLPGLSPVAPPRWKMALVTWGVAFPLMQVYQALLGPWLRPLPRMLQGAIVGALMVASLTWWAMPLATGKLRRWLFR